MLEQVIAENTAAIQEFTVTMKNMLEALKAATVKPNEYEVAVPVRKPDFKTTSANRQARKAAQAAAKVPRGTAPAADLGITAVESATADEIIAYDTVAAAIMRVLEQKGMPATKALLATFKTADGVPCASGKDLAYAQYGSAILACNKALAIV